MTFRECMALTWKKNPFKPFLSVVGFTFGLIGIVVGGMAIVAGPPILIEDYFVSRDMHLAFAVTVISYWVILGLVGSFLFTMSRVCKPGRKS